MEPKIYDIIVKNCLYIASIPWVHIMTLRTKEIDFSFSVLKLSLPFDQER